jgi:hypothetical protein
LTKSFSSICWQELCLKVHRYTKNLRVQSQRSSQQRCGMKYVSSLHLSHMKVL